MKDVKKYLIFSQASLLILLGVCTLIIPSVAEKEGGVSNFGNHISTVLLYSLSFVLEASLIYLAAIKIQKIDKKLAYIAKGLIVLSVLLLVLLISTFPRHISYTFSAIHDYIAIVLYSYQFLIGLWIITKKYNSKLLVFIIIQMIGSAISLLSILKYIDFLYVGQIVGSVGFSLVLIYGLPDVISKEAKS